MAVSKASTSSCLWTYTDWQLWDALTAVSSEIQLIIQPTQLKFSTWGSPEQAQLLSLQTFRICWLGLPTAGCAQHLYDRHAIQYSGDVYSEANTRKSVTLLVNTLSSYMLCTLKRNLDTLSVRSQYHLKCWVLALPSISEIKGSPSWPFLILWPNASFLLVKFITVYFLFSWYLSYTQLQGEMPLSLEWHFQSLWGVADHLAKSDSVRLKREKKASYAQEKG